MGRGAGPGKVERPRAEAVLRRPMGDASAEVIPPPIGASPPRLALHFNADSQIPVDIIFFRGGVTPPPIPETQPCRNVAVFTVDGGVVTAQARVDENLTISSNNNLNAFPPGPMCPTPTDSGN